MDCFYGYKVDAFIEDNEKAESFFGLISATNYCEAVQKISKMYGENEIENIFVELLSFDWSTFEVSKETYQIIKREAKERSC